MDHSSFANLSRDELIDRARAAGVDRPELMTRVELADELVRRAEPDPMEQRRARGWLGVARDLVASVVESGLNLPDAAAVIRGERGELELKGPEPVATVTLAEIYATQGHLQRALTMLDEVIANEPEHEAARRLRDRLLNERPTRLARSQALALRHDAEPAADHAEAAPAETETPSEPVESPVTSSPPAEAAPVEAVPSEAAPSEVVPSEVVPSEAAPSEAAPSETAPVEPKRVSGVEAVGIAEREPIVEDEQHVAALAVEEAEAFAHLDAFEDALSRVQSEPEPAPVEPEPEPAPAEPEPASSPVKSEPEPTPEADFRGSEPVTERPEPVTERPPEEPEATTRIPPRPATVVLLRGHGVDPIICWDVGGPMEESPELALVCVAFESTAQGIERSDLTVPILERRGRAVLESVPASATVRAALGVDEPSGFAPIAIASELELRDGVLRVLYRPPASESAGPTDEERALVQAFAPGPSIAAPPNSP